MSVAFNVRRLWVDAGIQIRENINDDQQEKDLKKEFSLIH